MTASSLKLHGLPNTPNTNKVLIAAKYANVNLDMIKVEFGKTNKSTEFLAKFPLGKVPAMETTEGPLFESNALAFYVASSKKPELLGKDSYEQALVIQHICTLDCELQPLLIRIVYPIYGYAPYVALEWNKAFEELLAKLKIYDQMLLPRTFLVGESITLADILLTCTLERVFSKLLDAPKRKELVNLTRWFVTMINQPQVKAVMGEVKLADKMIDPAEEAAKVQSASKPAPAPASSSTTTTTPAQDEEDEEEAPKPKAEKNAMDLLPPSKFNLEEWKRFYSNCKETRPVATNWFWEHFDPEGFSIWRGTYKYNDELKKIFMTCNLVTGLFARMEAMRKYCFASVLIFGEDDKNEISGFFVIRGKEMPELMKEVPDFESYDWTLMDINDAKQRELFNDYLAWEGDLEGKTVNQGKTFK